MAAAPATPAPAPARTSSWVDTLVAVVWESKRIVAAHTRHFLALSVFFLLPLSLLLVAAPSLLASLLLPPDPLLPPHETLLRGTAGGHLAAPLACAAAAAFLALCAAAAVTRSVKDGFFGRRVRVSAALRSLFASLWRLLITSLSAAVVLAAYAAIVISMFLLCLRVLPFLGFHEDHLDPAVFATAAAAVMVLGAFYLQVNWALAGVVAVAESNWGFDPLRRSAHPLLLGCNRISPVVCGPGLRHRRGGLARGGSRGSACGLRFGGDGGAASVQPGEHHRAVHLLQSAARGARRRDRRGVCSGVRLPPVRRSEGSPHRVGGLAVRRNRIRLVGRCW